MIFILSTAGPTFYIWATKKGKMGVWNGKRFSLTLCQEEAGHLALYLCYPSTLAPKLDTLPKLLPTKTLGLKFFFKNVLRFQSSQICQNMLNFEYKRAWDFNSQSIVLKYPWFRLNLFLGLPLVLQKCQLMKMWSRF